MLIKVRLSGTGAVQSRILEFERSLAIFGFSRTLQNLLKRVLGKRGEQGPSPPRNLRHPFDVAYGVETSGLIDGRELRAGHEHDRFNLAYYGVQPSLFRRACQRWAQTLPAVSQSIRDYTFIDIGAGKGRAVLLASELGFGDVFGVELNAELAEVAGKNIEIWLEAGRGDRNLRVVRQDATEVTWPQTPLLIYLFNPFGWRVLERLIEVLELSYVKRRRPIDLLYVNPEFSFVLDRHAGLELLWSERIPTDASEHSADWFASTGELCKAYRFRGRGRQG